jgi:HSP20 family protein
MTASSPRPMPMDLYRDADNYVLTADLPGIDPDSVDVDVDGQLLSIRAERAVRTQQDVRWIARERSFGSYLRRFTLGQGIDTAHISANYDNGVLSVILPVTEKAKPRKVQVQTSPAPAEAALSGAAPVIDDAPIAEDLAA